MSNADGVMNTPSGYAANMGMDAVTTTVSPDLLLAYCQAQLGDLDSQIGAQMNAQKTALREREAVQSAQAVLGQYGTAGPPNATEMQKCVTALDNAIAQLPANDPVSTQLADFRKQMCDKYQFTPARPLTDGEQSLLQIDQAFDRPLGGITNPLLNSMGTQDAQVKYFEQLQTTGILGQAPNKDTREWQGTTDALGNIANDIKSNAEIQMLQLQDLVSQRQQAVQLASGLMSKEDQTLEAQAKAIGQ
jgi:hypothetical protein